MSQQKLQSGLRGLTWVLISIIMVGTGLARAQSEDVDSGHYLAGISNAPALMNALNFADLPAGPATAAIVRLAAQGVLSGDGSGNFRPQAAVSREQAITALVRLLGWEHLAQQPEVDQGSRGADMSAWAAPFIDVAVARGLISGGNTQPAADTGAWTDPATREEIAAWCIRALELSAGRAAAKDAHTLAAYSDASNIRSDLVGAVQQALDLGLLEPLTSNRLAPKGTVSRGELALILDQLVRMLPAGAWEVATLESYTVEREEIAGREAESVLWLLARPGGSKAALKLSFDYENHPLVQTVVLDRQGQLTYGNVLRPGDSIRYLIQGAGSVPFIEVLPAGPATISGYIERLDLQSGQIVIRDEAQVSHNLFLAPTVNILIGGRPAALTELALGLEAAAVTLDQMALKVVIDPAADLAPDPPTLQVSGQVRTVDTRGLVLVFADGRTAQYDLNASTQVIVGGRLSTAASIQPGDWVQLYLPSPTSTWAERVIVAGSKAHYVELYRGRLGKFPAHSGWLALTDVQRLNGGIWEADRAVMDLPLRPDTALWHKNQRIDLAAAQLLSGAEVYAAVSAGFGRPELLQAVIWRGAETAYSGAIDRINPGLGLLSLPRAELLLSPGAVIVKDGRLIDPYSLAAGDSIQVLACRSGRDTIGLAVSVIGRELEHFPGYLVYRGYIDQVGRTAFTLTAKQEFSAGSWGRRRRGSKDLGVNRDTMILSLLAEKPHRLSGEEFQQGFWQDHYHHAQALVVAEADEVLGLALWPEDELDTARLSRGKIAAVTQIQTRPGQSELGLGLDLDNAADFSPARQVWEYSGGYEQEGLDTGSALVIKDGRAYTGAVLATGDEIVFLRRGRTVLLVWVKE